MKIKPLADNILIEPIEQAEQTKGGIFLPKTADKERPEQGKVVAVGPGKKDSEGKIIPIDVKPGDRVLFTKYGPNEIKVDEKEYLIAKQEDVLAVVEE
jgi:chaperonin GroES